MVALLLNIFLGYMLFEKSQKNTTTFNMVYGNLHGHLTNTSSSIENYLETNDKSYLNKAMDNINAAKSDINLLKVYLPQLSLTATFDYIFIKLDTEDAESLHTYLNDIKTLHKVMVTENDAWEINRSTIKRFLCEASKIEGKYSKITYKESTQGY